MWKRRIGKYGAIKQNYGGHTYDSKKEARYAMELDLRKKAGEIKGWDRQVKIPLTVNGKLIGYYKIDFVIHHKNGTKEYTETKGVPTTIWRWKWKHFEAEYPDYKKTIIW